MVEVKKFTLWETNWGERVKDLMGACGATTYYEYKVEGTWKLWRGVLGHIGGGVCAEIEFNRVDYKPGADRCYEVMSLNLKVQ